MQDLQHLIIIHNSPSTANDSIITVISSVIWLQVRAHHCQGAAIEARGELMFIVGTSAIRQIA